MKKLLLPLLLISLNSFSQDNGRISQSTTLIIWYKVLPNNTYDIFVQNAAQDTSVIQYVLNDSSYSVRLGYWQKHRLVHHYPNGFTLRGKNMNHHLAKWQECGSNMDVLKVKEIVKKSSIIKKPCNEIPIRVIRTVPNSSLY